MKRIKLFEDFDNSLVTNVEEILLQLRNFGFEVNIQKQYSTLTIEIYKSKGEEFKVFYYSDISNLIEECDSYLSLGEGIKLETIHLNTVQGDKEIETLNSLRREGVGILSLFMSYHI